MIVNIVVNINMIAVTTTRFKFVRDLEGHRAEFLDRDDVYLPSTEWYNDLYKPTSSSSVTYHYFILLYVNMF